jgi:uncharacterized protein
MTTDPLGIIGTCYDPHGSTYALLVAHGRRIAAKALAVARCVPHLNPDLGFIREAALLHDIGIFLTRAPGLGCIGPHPYVCHGVLGAEILKAWGLPDHAAVCERHVGAGLTAAEIDTQGLPLPRRDMLPVSVEERIIAYADKFFSKLGPPQEKSPAEIVTGLERYAPAAAARFRAWHDLFAGHL